MLWVHELLESSYHATILACIVGFTSGCNHESKRLALKYLALVLGLRQYDMGMFKWFEAGAEWWWVWCWLQLSCVL